MHHPRRSARPPHQPQFSRRRGATGGLTGIHDKDGARGAPEAFAALAASGELTLRVWQSLPLECVAPEDRGRFASLLAGGSDAPVEPLDPIAGLAAAVARTADARPAWRPQEAIGIDAALASFTAAPAFLEEAEGRRGRLAPGFDADLVVLDRDPRACEPAELAAIGVRATMLAGRWTSFGGYSSATAPRSA